MNHPTQTVTVGAMSAEIDEEIAPLIEALWARGIHTISCCQGGERPAYISFAPRYFEMFLDVAGSALETGVQQGAGPDLTYVRVLPNASATAVREQPRQVGAWCEVSAYFENGCWCSSVTLRFWGSHIPGLTAAFA